MFLSNKYSFRLTSTAKARKAMADSAVEADAVETDSGKRAFLRLAGIAGLGVVAATVFPKKAEAYVLGSTPTSPIVGVKDSTNTRINPAKEDGNLATVATAASGIKTQTDKLTFDGSNNLYVQAATGFSSQLENASSVVINPATEDSLVTVKNQLNKLTFDGSNNLLTASTGGVASAVTVKDTTSTQINPATEDSVILLRRMVKIMESQASADAGNRQRITIDSLGTSTAVTTTIPVSGTVTASVSGATLAAGSAAIGSVTIDSQGRQMFTEIARQAYNSGIRSNIVFS